jgi:hypothetical protein
MYAIIRHNTYDPVKLAEAGQALAEFQALHARQPGYAGSIIVDLGGGQQIAVNLWHAQQDANAGQSALVPHVQRLLEPLMSGPSRLVGAGKAAATDLPPGLGPF